MRMLVQRNLKLYFRDRASVFFSLMSVLITFGLYVFFLGDNYIQGHDDLPGVKYLMDSWIMAGILAITGMSTTLAALGTMVDDRSHKITNDFYASPVSRARLAGGYLLSALVIGVIMSIITFFIAELYIAARGGALLSIGGMLRVLAVIPLSVVSSGSMVFFMVLFFKSQNAFGTASTIIGTLIGFLTGIYLPIGSLNSTLQFLIKIFPVSYAGSLFRRVMMEQAIAQSFASAPPGAADSFEKYMGVTYAFGSNTVGTRTGILILLGVTVLFYALSVIRLNGKRDSL
jgi:ABC-2 type transporter.